MTKRRSPQPTGTELNGTASIGGFPSSMAGSNGNEAPGSSDATGGAGMENPLTCSDEVAAHTEADGTSMVTLAGEGIMPEAELPSAGMTEPSAQLIQVGKAEEGAAPDPFDLASLRLTSDFAEVETPVLTGIGVHKPNPNAYIRVHPAPEYRLPITLLEGEEGRDPYLVQARVASQLPDEPAISPRLLLTAITRLGQVFLWPVKLPRADQRPCLWHTTALNASKLAEKSWIRIYSILGRSGYTVLQAKVSIPEPEWPTESFQELIRLAFGDRIIDSLDHPILRQLRGEE